MASIAVLPILIGLAVDYAIQFQARFDEAMRAGAPPGPRRPRRRPRRPDDRAPPAWRPRAGFLVLLLSPIPMVRGFALLLVVGIVVAFALALTAGFAALSLGRGGESPVPLRARVLAATDCAARRARYEQRIAALGSGGAGTRACRRARPGVSHRRTPSASWRGGWSWRSSAGGSGPRSKRDLGHPRAGPAEPPALQDVDELEDATGVSGELDVSVSAPDLTDPEVISLDARLQAARAARHGFAGANPCCQAGRDLPGISLPDFLSGGGHGSAAPARITARRSDSCPHYDWRRSRHSTRRPASRATPALISVRDPGPVATTSRALIDDVRGRRSTPGPGTARRPGSRCELAGLPVIAADAASALSEQPLLVTLAGLLAVALVLLAVYRSRAARAGAAGPDRARDRLVVAGPLGDRGAAQPDVGHARCAR